MTSRTPRTLLEALIIERRETFEEFSEAVTSFGRDNGESGTLSPRHAQRLASGDRADGRPLGPVRPATARVLEMMLGHAVEELLGPPIDNRQDDDETDLIARLAASRGADSGTVAAFQQRLDLARVLDRRLGADHLVTELAEQVRHMQELCRYSTDGTVRRALAAVIADACALIGWQLLDKGDPSAAWDYYAQASTAATEAESEALRSYVLAAQSVVLLDVNDTKAAAQMTEHAVDAARGGVSEMLGAWLAAAHGEACAASGLRTLALKSFDDAEQRLAHGSDDQAPFLVFGSAHLSRWRGSALARMGDREAVSVLGGAISVLPPDFARAETGLRADLARAYAMHGDRDAAHIHAAHADQLARRIGSTRHRKRVARLRLAISPPGAA